MTCWKTINLYKDYGFHRITLISCISMFLAFIGFYLSINLIFSHTVLHSDGIFFFIIGLICIYPFHEVMHAVPLWILKKPVQFNVKMKYNIFPLISTRTRHILGKSIIILMLGTPFITITSIMLLGCMLFPGYFHYFTILAAINFGFCVPDLIYLTMIVKAPKSCVVEEIEDGYDILIQEAK